MSLRSVVALSLAVLVTACGTERGEQSVFDPVVQTISSVGRAKARPLTADQIRGNLTPEIRAQYSGLSLKVAVLERQELASILIESETNRDTVTYFTPDGISVALKQGVLVGTRGLGFDLMTADVTEVIGSLHSGARAVRIHHYLDGEDKVVMRSFICDYAGHTTVTETCYSDGFEIQNRYTMHSGRITASRQWISPEQGYIRLEPAT